MKLFLSGIAAAVLSHAPATAFTPPGVLKRGWTAAPVLSSSTSALSVASTLTVDNDKSSDNSDNQIAILPDAISAEHPLRVVIAGAGVGGLILANDLYHQAATNNLAINVTVLEQTDAFKRFGGPIQLASNALEILKTQLPADLYQQIQDKFTVTGDKMNGIKDGIRTEWYAKFDLATPAKDRKMPYTGVIDRSDLQQICLNALPAGTVQNGDGIVNYVHDEQSGSVKAVMESGKVVQGDVLIGADGIWSAVRAHMRGTPRKGNDSGASYSGYTLFAGELKYASPDNGEVGYKVYIGPGQYFVITDIGKGNYQWYAFLGRPPDSAASEEKPAGTSAFLQSVFKGWSEEIHDILRVTKEDEIEQRDLYDRPPSVFKSWTDGRVALFGDGIHAMMPNLGQGGCQAIEDAFVLSQELRETKKRSQLSRSLKRYQNRRLIRSAAVQGLSRFASDIIILGFDTPAKIRRDENGMLVFENFNYAGIVTKLLQPILPLFFMIQFNFLYDGWKNEKFLDVPSAVTFSLIGSFILLLFVGSAAEAGLLTGIGIEALLGAEGLFDYEAISTAFRELFVR